MSMMPLTEEQERKRREQLKKIYQPGLITILSGIGNNLQNGDDDVRLIRTALDGLLKTPQEEQEKDYQGRPLGIITERMEKNIRQFQAENNFKE